MDEVVTLLQSILERLEPSELVYTTHELALKLKTHDQRIDLYRNEGLISAIKNGQGFVYTQRSVDQFLEDFDGMDLSSKTAIQIAKIEVAKRKRSSTGTSRRSSR
ncbi:hypothetical protein [Holdemania massiliensis]|uniref:DNA-binding protein n=1 Tax=Holdemania massiliensis TaxID=1468449 RepID=A0A6N7S6C6_9FIRM|nr:hypothetical protein [Holdemania massiliensis]MSA71335.1 hypothetical protein [Holdemania massiliensis]MSA89242.1 hypothetical protein [Holdemania massiliensis]MSB78415.1 hypothetical protein [Holdemania massiliensis]MSC33339.1 hypothetical protein [Holdemania massiliensis]MSC39317.1 hypothetical protein [Holdemania massiliensis]